MAIHVSRSYMIGQRKVVIFGHFVHFHVHFPGSSFLLKSHSLDNAVIFHATELKLALSGGACSPT
ncbi:hypothetical protein HOLleu_26041 [Holothuria leucospilota]|uniref:Uncharacterized protein n=1 Tax=Holothuria leucospilota TaxID=206669 RepID=A0A9Q1BTQ0_HOLLE|nr:hypothetical protein HOLleu_26041 [Holothuria leucospilota]